MGRFTLFAGIAAIASAGTGGAADRVPVTLGTATPGGGFPLYGQAVAETINATDPTLDVQPRNTKGSTENVPLLDAGKIDLGLVTGEVVHEALSGIGRPKADLRVLAAMYSSPGMFVLRADSPARSIQDLKGKTVVFGAKGFRAGGACALRARRYRSRHGAGFQRAVPRARGRRTENGARWPGRGAVGRRPRLAGLQGDGGELRAARASSFRTPTAFAASSRSMRFCAPSRCPRIPTPDKASRSSRWVRGVSSWRAPGWMSPSRTGSRAHCIWARRNSGSASRWRARPLQPIPWPPPSPNSSTPACCDIFAKPA